MSKTICSIEGCTKLVQSRGWCSKHYKRWSVHGDPLTVKIVEENHGYHRTPTYSSWANMKTRCDNPKYTHYRLYGGKGVRYCERWKSFTLFLEDMGERPEGTTLDRIDSDGDYEPSNCRWATPREQSENRKSWIRKIEIDGRTQTMTRWAEEVGISVQSISNKINRDGMTPEDAVRHFMR